MKGEQFRKRRTLSRSGWSHGMTSSFRLPVLTGPSLFAGTQDKGSRQCRDVSHIEVKELETAGLPQARRTKYCVLTSSLVQALYLRSHFTEHL